MAILQGKMSATQAARCPTPAILGEQILKNYGYWFAQAHIEDRDKMENVMIYTLADARGIITFLPNEDGSVTVIMTDAINMLGPELTQAALKHAWLWLETAEHIAV